MPTIDHYAPDFDVAIQGTFLGADVRRLVTSLSYENALDTADVVEIQVMDPGSSLIDSPLFAPGKTVDVSLGYAGQLQPVFTGEVAAITASYSGEGPPSVAVTAYDRSYKMRTNSPARPPFKLMNDSLIAAQIAIENGLVPIVDPSPLPPRQEIQPHGSDFAFLRDLATRNGFDLFVRGNQMFFQFPRPQLFRTTLAWGKNLFGFEPRLTTAGLAGLQVIRGYNEELAQAVVAVLPTIALGGDIADTLARLGEGLLQQLAGLGRRLRADAQVDDPIDALTLARSVLDQLIAGVCEGTGRCVGLPDLRAGNQVKIEGVGSRFSGTYRLRSVRHTIDDGGYTTQFEFGPEGRDSSSLLAALRFAMEEFPPTKSPPRMQGVVPAVVTDNQDLLGLGRVRVTFPFLSDENQSGWARIATIGASGDAGIAWIPAVGDEVLVAFQQGEFQKPVVIGGLWSLTRTPPASNRDGLNSKRVIRTPAGHAITFDDGPAGASVEVAHAEGHTVTLGAGGSITLKGNAITLKGTSITLESDGDVVLKAGPHELKVSAT